MDDTSGGGATKWYGRTEVLQFYVVVDGKEHSATVSRECLSDHCGMSAKGGVDAHSAFERNADSLRRLAEAKVRAGEEEPLIRTADWRG